MCHYWGWKQSSRESWRACVLRCSGRGAQKRRKGEGKIGEGGLGNHPSDFQPLLIWPVPGEGVDVHSRANFATGERHGGPESQIHGCRVSFVSTAVNPSSGAFYEFSFDQRAPSLLSVVIKSRGAREAMRRTSSFERVEPHRTEVVVNEDCRGSSSHVLNWELVQDKQRSESINGRK